MIRHHDFDNEVNALSRITSVMPDTMILVSRCKPMGDEYRIVIGGDGVIAWSKYRSYGDECIEPNCPSDVISFGNNIAKHKWTPDMCYACDIMKNGEELKIIEINSFSCAGLYACDLDKVVKVVSECAMKEWHDYQVSR